MKLRCPECGRGVIMFRFAEKDQWYHLATDGIPDPTSPACARPVYSKAVDTEQLLSTLDNIAPIHITSHGPTHADKQWVGKEVLA